MSRREQVEKALRFRDPDYLPVLYFNGDRTDSDLIMVDVVDHYGDQGSLSEWGFEWEKHDETMGQPVASLIDSLRELAGLSVPPAAQGWRLNAVEEARAAYGADRYYIGSLVLSGFSVISAIRGFSDSLIDLSTDEDRFGELADLVFRQEEEVIRYVAGAGLDAIAFFDDWGMQESMLISPDLWREVFKSRYKRQFEIVHELGMTVYFHSCGFYYDIIQDFIEIGVDFLNISQPNLYDFGRLSSDFGGSVCFVCPVSYQTTAVNGDRAEIFSWVSQTLDHLNASHGGLIGYLEHYESIQINANTFRACEEAFRVLGRFAAEEASDLS